MNQAISNETLVDRLMWRYAVKKFEATKKIPDKTWDALEQALVLTPSSFGLQPWKFIVITNAALKEKLFAHSGNQKQIVTCSHLVVCAAKKETGAKEIEEFINLTAATRNLDLQSLEPYKQSIMGSIVDGSMKNPVHSWAVHQIYIALGNLMTSAALLGVDTCPMEGFDAEAYDSILELPLQGLSATVLCTAGYRAPDDAFQNVKKVRFSRDLIIEHR